MPSHRSLSCLHSPVRLPVEPCPRDASWSHSCSAETVRLGEQGTARNVSRKLGLFLQLLWGAERGSCTNGDRKGLSYSSAPATYINRPSPSSKLAVLMMSELATSSAHFTNQAARLSEIPRWYVWWRSSNPTHVTLSPPAVFPQERGTPAVAQRTKKEIRAVRYSVHWPPGESRLVPTGATCWRFVQ